MDRSLQLMSDDYPNIMLRGISTSDMENLRCWKNNNRKSFFYQEIIQPEQQLKWFEGYQSRPDDYMFMVEEMLQENGKTTSNPIGCMAFRIEDDDTIDLYNIIRGTESMGKVSMKDAMYMMLTYIHQQFPDKKIKCDVLKDNPAVLWYQKCGFAIWEEKEYYIMGVSIEDIPMIKIDSKEE